MNNSKILAPEKKIGAITVTNLTGGDIDWEKIVPERSIRNAIPEHYGFFTLKELREFGNELKVQRAQVPKPFKLVNGVLKRVSVSDEDIEELELIDFKIAKVYEALNKKNDFKFRRIELKNLSITYEIRNPGKSMIRHGIRAYEVKEKGDKMKNKIFIEEPEFPNEFGIKEPDVYMDHVLPCFKDGELKNHDLVVLHNSGRLGFEMNKKIVKTNELERYSTIKGLLKNVRKDGVKVLLPNGRLTPYIERNNYLVDIDKVQRIEFNIYNDSQNGLSEEYLKDLRVKDSKFGFVPITRYNEDDHAYEIAWENMLVFNKINYEEHKLVLVGKENQLEALQKGFKERDNEGCYYNFSGQNLRSYDENFVGRVSQDEYFSSEGDIEYCFSLSSALAMSVEEVKRNRELVERCKDIPPVIIKDFVSEEIRNQRKIFRKIRRNAPTPSLHEYMDGTWTGLSNDTREFRRTEEGVVGLNEVSDDKDLKKYLRSFDFPGVPRNNEEEEELFSITEEVFSEIEERVKDEAEELPSTAKKLFLEAEKVHGRLKQSNIEHELRRELKYLKQKSSRELYFLFQYIEENMECHDEVEIVGGTKRSKTVYNKKHMALRNVVQDYYFQVERHEQETEGLTSDLQDLVTIEKDGFKADKKAKNLYDQQKGVLAPNQNPQRMEHIPEITPDELAFYKQEASLERRERQEVDDLLRIYKEVKSAVREDGSFKMVEILDVEATKKLGGLSVGGRPHFPSSSKVSYLERITRVPAKKVYPSKPPVWMLDILHLSYKDSNLLQDTAVEVQGYIPTRKFQEIIRYCIRGYQAGIGEEKVYMPGWFCPPKKYYSEKVEEKVEKGFVYEYVPATITGWPHYEGLKCRATFECGHHDWVSTKRGIRNKKESSSSYSSISNYRIIGKEKDTYLVELKIDDVTKTFYAQGNLKALQQQSIAVVGTRNPSIETNKFIKYGVKRLVEDGCVIISGLAKGCDTIAHKACLEAGGITIAVLPSGLERITPRNNKVLVKKILENNGLVLSQYEPFSNARRNTYLERNGVIANLSDEVLICEAGSGTMNTYGHAKRLGKQIYVQDINSKYNKDLIENKGEDILLI